MSLSSALIVFAILWMVRKRPHPLGAIFYLYLILAGSMRFIVEFWRVNPVVAAGLTEYQWMSAVLVAIGIFATLAVQWIVSRALHESAE